MSNPYGMTDRQVARIAEGKAWRDLSLDDQIDKANERIDALFPVDLGHGYDHDARKMLAVIDEYHRRQYSHAVAMMNLLAELMDRWEADADDELLLLDDDSLFRLTDHEGNVLYEDVAYAQLDDIVEALCDEGKYVYDQIGQLMSRESDEGFVDSLRVDVEQTR